MQVSVPTVLCQRPKHIRILFKGGDVAVMNAEASAADLIEESNAENWRSSLGSLQLGQSASTDGRGAAVVALGKFDALHRGHRLLVEQAASMGDAPWLISFSGMAQELGGATDMQGRSCLVKLSVA